MNFDIFDEQYYLSQYPWLKPAVDQGIIKSGKEHFEKFGREAGLTQVSRYFDETIYWTQNLDIATFIRRSDRPDAPFASGLDHFIQFGYEQGRSSVSLDYNEEFYLKNNSELLPFIQNGTFKSGYQHFIRFGSKEGRFGTSFFETEYLKKNPDLVPFINSGNLRTGREHYFQFGRLESNRSATFVGTSGNDYVDGFSDGNDELIGVEVGLDPQGNRQYESLGTKEFDTLTGGGPFFDDGRIPTFPDVDVFVLGVPATAKNSATPLYLGEGQARIFNFRLGQDFIQLQGSFADYQVEGVGVNLVIRTQSGDVIGIIEKPYGSELNGFEVAQVNSDGTFLLRGVR